MCNIAPHNPDLSNALSSIASVLCSPLVLGGRLCNIGSIRDQFDDSINSVGRYAIAAAHLPAGAGWRNVMHYGQLMVTEKPVFRRLDYDSASENR